VGIVTPIGSTITVNGRPHIVTAREPVYIKTAAGKWIVGGYALQTRPA